MADAHLRELERRSAQGDPDASRELLRERVRAGEVSRDRLELAAYAGDPDARALTDLEPPADDAAWLAGFAIFGHDAFQRAGWTAAFVALAGWEAWGAGEFAPGSRVRNALALIEQGDDPAARLALVHARQALDNASQLLGGLEAEHGLRLTSAWRAHRAGLAALSAAERLGGLYAGAASVAGWTRELPASVDHDRLRAAIRDAIVPWAQSLSE